MGIKKANSWHWASALPLWILGSLLRRAASTEVNVSKSIPLPFSTTFSRSHLLDTSWLTVGVSEQVIGMGAEADGLAAGAGLVMTTAGWGTAGVGWMGCTYEKRANKPLRPTCPAQGLRVPAWSRGRAKMGMKSSLTSTCLLCAIRKQAYKLFISTHPMTMASKVSTATCPTKLEAHSYLGCRWCTFGQSLQVSTLTLEEKPKPDSRACQALNVH